MKKLIFGISILIIIVLLFASFNFGIYMFLTSRLSNNFSGTDQAKMIDVSAFLPHEAESSLPDLECSLALSGDLPVLDGAAALVPVYASVIDTVYPIGSVTYDGGEFSDDNYYGENFAPDSKMQYKNTVRGYKAIVDGETDILFCASPSDDQKKYAEDKGVKLVYIPIGLEAFVFFVNENNPVDDLSADEIRRIYSGEIKNWSEVGGANRVINPVTRLKGSGSQTTMEAFMKGRDLERKSMLAIFGGSIGFSFRYYMNGIVENENVKILSMNGIAPTPENIKNGTYPVIAEFYAIYREDNENENIPILIDWLLSDEGQTLIEKNGYIGIK
ncbi:MAG: substrate-binding domain-containing protein [Clostridia bacterium]|nr:substrate-binding domain-containing protein [Clostridia bacterium]